jgi:hypothetical protein
MLRKGEGKSRTRRINKKKKTNINKRVERASYQSGSLALFILRSTCGSEGELSSLQLVATSARHFPANHNI